MDNEEFENKNHEQLVRNVLNKKFDAVKGKTNKKEWNELMDESNKEVKKYTSRTRVFAIAASIALIAAIGGSVLVVANNNDSKNLNTIDKQPKKNNPQETSTTTTIPLTEEETLLQNTVVVKRTITGTVPTDGSTPDSELHMFDAKGNEIIEFAALTKGDKTFDPGVLNINHNVITIISRVSPSCDEVSFGYFDIASRKAFSSVGEYMAGRVYSPDGKQYAEFSGSCYTQEEIGIGYTLNIINVATGSKRTIKPEPFINSDNNLPADTKIYASALKWIDNNEFLLGTRLTGADGMDWKLASLDKTISLNNAKDLSDLITSGSYGDTVNDTKVVDGKAYVLQSEEKNGDSTELSVKEVATNKVVWSKIFDSQYVEGGNFQFGDSLDVVYGSSLTSDYRSKTTAFIYNNKTGNVFRPEGELILKVR